MMFKKRVIASLLPLVFAQLAYAAEPQSIELNAVTVSGILPEKLESVPGSFSVINKRRNSKLKDHSQLKKPSIPCLVCIL